LKDADRVSERLAGLPAAGRSAVLDGLAHRAIPPYAVMAVVLLGLAGWIFFSALPEVEDDGVVAVDGDRLLDHPHLLLGAMTLFLYVGVEVIAGDTIINYGMSQGISMNTARFFTSATLINMLIGYFFGILLIPRFLSQPAALKLSSGLGLCFAAAALATHGVVSVCFIALLGLANALVWPSMWPLAIEGLGKLTALGSSLLIIAIGGGAVLPLLYGWLAEHSTPREAYWIVVPCYVCIGWYAFRGRLVGRPAAKAL
jgi:fucose permease